MSHRFPPTAIDDPILITGEKKIFAYFDNPRTFGVFRDFMVQEGVSAAPELQQFDAAIAAQKRVKAATSRAFGFRRLPCKPK